MKKIPDGSVDLVLTDPPYNIARDNNFHTMGRAGIDFGEWEKKIREKLSVAGSDGFAIDADIDGVIEIVTQTLTSRDTYWRETISTAIAGETDQTRARIMHNLDILDNLK